MDLDFTLDDYNVVDGYLVLKRSVITKSRSFVQKLSREA